MFTLIFPLEVESDDPNLLLHDDSVLTLLLKFLVHHMFNYLIFSCLFAYCDYLHSSRDTIIFNHFHLQIRMMLQLSAIQVVQLAPQRY